MKITLSLVLLAFVIFSCANKKEESKAIIANDSAKDSKTVSPESSPQYFMFGKKRILFGSSKDVISRIFSNLKEEEIMNEPEGIISYTKNYDQVIDGSTIPIDISFLFYKGSLFKVVIVEYYTAEYPNPPNTEKTNIDIDFVMKQFIKSYEKDTLGLTATIFNKDNLTAMHISEDQGYFICYDNSAVAEIKKEIESYEPFSYYPFY